MSHLERWTVNESLLQSYRSIFVSSQSFLLAVGAILPSKSPWLLYSVSALAVGMIWAVWFPVVRSRFLIVDYHKYMFSLAESKAPQVCSEHDYVHDAGRRDELNALFGIETNWRPTRIKMDVVLPVVFTVMWALLVAHELGGHRVH